MERERGQVHKDLERSMGKLKKDELRDIAHSLLNSVFALEDQLQDIQKASVPYNKTKIGFITN